MSPLLQNNQSKVNWKCGSSNRVPDLPVPDLQMQNPEFKPQSHKKKKKKERKKAAKLPGTGLTLNILVLVGHQISTASAQLCCYSTKSAR
jgi:hypothetical protein